MLKKNSTTSGKLNDWQTRLAESNTAYSDEVSRMNERERLYGGDDELKPLVPNDRGRDGHPKKTSHVRNIIFENIESQINSSIPQPQVTARRRKDEPLAEIIENFLRNELNRLPFETINDMAERTVPIQGGVGFLVEWDNTRRTHDTVGEVVVSVLHPKQFAPQPGVFTGIDDMDWFILKIPTTKAAVRRRYGIDVRLESESEPDVRGAAETDAADDALTQYIGFEKNPDGGIDRYAWVNDTELEDLKNYQARRIDENELETEQIVLPDMSTIDVPYYKPEAFPIILQRSVSVYGQLLGNSDVDCIRHQQNTMNRMEQKIIDRLIKAGTRITLPDKADIRIDPEDGEKIYIGNPADKSLIDVYDFTGDLSYELSYLNNVYEEARQIIGITDSFQGRRDATATSGKAKEFAAAQTAGRLESKRVMKDAAYAAMFELMFKFWLAYSDEPRQVVYKNFKGENEYMEFNRYDFLEQDANGKWYWNDRFLFSCDTSAPLANNREAMWQETRMNLQTGAFGDPTSPETLILFWSKMEELHYPGAGATKKFLEEKLKREQQAAQMQQQQMALSQGLGGETPALSAGQVPQLPPEVVQAVEQQARMDAMNSLQIPN